MKHKMQPAPNIGREIIPDNAYLLKKHFKNIREHEIRASQPLPKNDKTYNIMRQRGQISGLSEALLGYNASLNTKSTYKKGDDDVASKLGVQTYQIPSLKTSPVDYRAAMTMDAQRPTYVPSNPIRYSHSLDDELLDYEL